MVGFGGYFLYQQRELDENFRIDLLMELAGYSENEAIEFNNIPEYRAQPLDADGITFAEMRLENKQIADLLHRTAGSFSNTVHGDPDEDLAESYYEMLCKGTDPLNPDTSGDGLKDGVTVKLGLDPLKKYPGFSDAIKNLPLEKINLDIDSDNMNNEFEWIHREEVGGLYDPFVKNDRYAIVVDGMIDRGGFADVIIESYVRQKIPSQNIITILSTEENSAYEIPPKFIDAIKELSKKVDNNDFVFINNETHQMYLYLPHSLGGIVKTSEYLDEINAKLIVFVDGECNGNRMVEYLKEGKIPRILMGEVGGAIIRVLMGLADLPGYGEYNLEDLDGNGYISVLEAFHSNKNSIGPPRADENNPKIIDLDNLSNKVYLGDLKFS